MLGLSNQNYSKRLYSIDLKKFELQSFINISGEYNKDSSSRFPVWAIVVTVLGCALFVILLIATIWFYLRYKKRVKANDKSKHKMQDVWATASHENDFIKSGSAVLTVSRKGSTRFLMDSTLFENSIVNYECFQHEVDLEELTKVRGLI
jgi:cbb3-type cytochrome oxidase subunit 3